MQGLHIRIKVLNFTYKIWLKTREKSFMIGKILCIRIINSDKALNIYEAECINESLNDKTLVIPYECFNAKNDSQVKAKNANRNLGLVTYAKVVSMRGDTIILDRQEVVEKNSKEFRKNYAPSDKIICEYQNTVYKGKEIEGIYVLFEKTVKGFIPRKFLKDINKKYMINEEIEGHIVSINSNNQFILTQLGVNKKDNKQLKVREIYLGKLVDIVDNHYIFECLGKRVIVHKSMEMQIDSYARIFINKSLKRRNMIVYYGVIST